LLIGVFLASASTKNWQKIGHRICFEVAVLLFVIAVFPVGDWLLSPLESRFSFTKPEHVDGIIMLGGDEKTLISEKRGQPVAFDSARRYIMFASLAREYPNAKLIFTGGSGLLAPEAKLKDAEVARHILKNLGVPVDRMVFEDTSHNTRENAVRSADVIKPTPQQNWLLITSASHMPRSMACFRKAGWNVYAAPTGYQTTGEFSYKPQFNFEEHLRKMTVAMHEYYGLLAYKLLGYTDELWPK
jgi:uncharacterized SAM-binding protein YcdF (DUF218 family)